MEITMYELLGMIKDGKAPKKIRYNNIILYYDNDNYDYFKYHGDYLFRQLFYMNLTNEFLNYQVEILEEEKEIPEKLNIHYDKENRFQVKVDGKTTTEVICLKINELIDYLKSKGDE